MIEDTIKHVYSLLLEEKYSEVEAFTDGVRMTSAEIKQSISEYGRKLISYPELVKLDVIEVEGCNPKEWSVVAPIYTAEEGLSDLSLELSLIEGNSKHYKTELDNIRVR